MGANQNCFDTNFFRFSYYMQSKQNFKNNFKVNGTICNLKEFHEPVIPVETKFHDRDIQVMIEQLFGHFWNIWNIFIGWNNVVLSIVIKDSSVMFVRHENHEFESTCDSSNIIWLSFLIYLWLPHSTSIIWYHRRRKNSFYRRR